MAFHLGDYEVHRAPEGFCSIRQISSGEIMHSRNPPMEEAQRLYIEQSNLAERVRLTADESADTAAPLVIWDVGLGAATNAMAAILCYEAQAAMGVVRPLKIISFEIDLDPLRLAFKHNREFTYLRHPGPAGIMADARWQSSQHAGLSWTLLPGDFLAILPAAPPPDVIFFDMFSSRTSATHWTLDAFRQIFEACRGRAAELFTYSCSTPIRAALLGAGFYVARGCSIGEKQETTIALTPAACSPGSAYRHELLTSDWLEKWGRSGAKFPAGLEADQYAAFERVIIEHPQFQPAPAGTG
jgi:queuine tRNA-ribosyltransferase